MKMNSNGVVVRIKARLVAKGCSQMEGVDFGKIFVPLAKFNTIRIILGAAMGFGMHQMDVKMTFLNDVLDMQIHIKHPKG